jgi:hypothetical protein
MPMIRPVRGSKSLPRSAERFAAHLVGLYPLPMPTAPRHFGYYDPALLNPFFEELRARMRDAIDKTKQAFEHITSRRGVSAEWREIPEGADADPALYARYADLTILGQLDPDEPGSDSAASGAGDARFRAPDTGRALCRQLRRSRAARRHWMECFPRGCPCGQRLHAIAHSR